MDIATLIGILLGLGAIVGSIFLMTPDIGMFGSLSSFGIVFGGMIASVSVAFPLKDVLQLGAAMGAVFKGGGAALGAEIVLNCDGHPSQRARILLGSNGLSHGLGLGQGVVAGLGVPRSPRIL